MKENYEKRENAEVTEFESEKRWNRSFRVHGRITTKTTTITIRRVK